jgi:hypothetical protein
MDKINPQYVFDKSLKTYPTEVGSQNFKPDDIEKFKFSESEKLDKIFSVKFQKIKSDWQRLLDEIDLNKRLYSATHNFKPVIGGSYYLYKRETGEEFISIISPDEWDKFQFIGKYKFLLDGMWIED